MKLFVNGTHLYYTPTGLGIYTENIIRELLKELDNVKVFSGNTHFKHKASQKFIRTSSYLDPRNGTFGHFFRIGWEQSFLWAYTLIERPDILFSTVHEGVVLPLIKTKQVITVHDLIAVKFPQHFKRLKYYFAHFLPFILNNSSAVVCVSENTKKDLIEYYHTYDKPVYVIHPGYDKGRFSPKDPEKVKKKYNLKEYFLFVGDMRPHKNLNRLIEAFDRLNSDLQLVIAGKKDERFYPKIEQLAKGKGLGRKVKFLDYVPLEDLPYLYSGAIALTFPSLYEGFGLPALEAMACGCPVIASKISSLPEVCGDAAYYVDPYNVDDLAGALYKVWHEEGIRGKLRNMGLERAKLFSWEDSRKKHVKLFEELVSSSR